MSGIYIYDWMLNDNLGLSSNEILPYAIIFSYTIANSTMYESRESLSKRLRLSVRQTSEILKQMLKKELVLKSKKRHPGLKTFDYVTNLQMLSSVAASSGDERFVECVKKLLTKVDTFPAKCDRTSYISRKKLRTEEGSNIPYICEEISHNNINDKGINIIIDNMFIPPSKEHLKDLLYPIFFLRNDCNPHTEFDKFYNHYSVKQWKLSGGMLLDTDGKIVDTAKRWEVREKTDPPFPPLFFNFWKHLYGVAGQEMKQEMVLIERKGASPTSIKLKCSDKLGECLESLDDIILHNSSKATLPPNFILEWKCPKGEGRLVLNRLAIPRTHSSL